MDTAVMIAVVLGLTQVAKITGLPKKYAPLFALIIGVACSLIYVGMTGSAVLSGIIVALTSMGLYSGTKSTLK